MIDATGPRAAVGWLAFPLVPALLGTTYHRTINPMRADPRLWDGWDWTLQLGPLIGFGFLVGALAGLPEVEPGRRGRLRRLIVRRWVAVGVWPWAGFLAWAGLYYGDFYLGRWTGFQPSSHFVAIPDWMGPILQNGFFIPSLAYPWAVVGLVWMVRARRLSVLRRALRDGVVMAVGFVGTLFGGFWAATAVWRSYFFDPTIVPVVLVAAALASAGCSSTTTLGEVRRRELFDAMLMAWLIGLALVWRWRARGA